jgi:hypothetical protein
LATCATAAAAAIATESAQALRLPRASAGARRMSVSPKANDATVEIRGAHGGSRSSSSSLRSRSDGVNAETMLMNPTAAAAAASTDSARGRPTLTLEC